MPALAAVWQTDARDLAYDMGAPFKDLLNQKDKAFEALADGAKLTPAAMDERLSWTGVKAGNVRMEFRGELFVSRALRNPVMRGCPVCLRADAVGAKGPPCSAMVMRGDWQYREVSVCLLNRHPLIPLWKATVLQDRFDIGTRLGEIQTKILSGVFDQPRREASGYDVWLDRRLQDGFDDTWLKDQPISVVAPICRLLGQSLLKTNTSVGTNVLGGFHETGFAVAVEGKEAIRAAFVQIVVTATGAVEDPRKIFGPLYTKLSQDYLNEPDFDPYRDILRECILDHWPKATGDVVLGQALTERRLHSISTAEKETGTGAKVLEHFLVEAGALRTNDSRPRNRRLFDAKAYAELLAEIPTLVGPIAMRTAIGATKAELLALADERLLVPRTRLEKIKNPWRISDGVALVAELSVNAILVNERNKDWETLLLACRRSGVTLKDLAREFGTSN